MYDLSVIIPAFNAEHTILTAIKSIDECLKNLNVEIIVVDDQSTDETAACVKSLIKENSHLSLYHTEKNSGAGVARNIGLSKATGQYIAFLDADDYYLPCVESVFYETLRQSPEITIYSYVVKDLGGRVNPGMMARDHQVWSCIKDDCGQITTIACAPAVLRLAGFPWNKFISRAYAIKIGMTFSGTYVLNDVYANFQSLLQSSSILILDNQAVCHIYEPNRKQLTNSGDYRRVSALNVLFDIERLFVFNPALLNFREYVYAFQDDVIDWVYANASIEHQSEIAEIYSKLKRQRKIVEPVAPLLEGKRLILYGLGWQMIKYHDQIATCNEVVGFMDSQLSKSTHSLFGIKIYHPADMSIPDYDYIVICSSAFEPIYDQLKLHGRKGNVLHIEQVIKHATLL